jgi:hypothetical protein
VFHDRVENREFSDFVPPRAGAVVLFGADARRIPETENVRVSVVGNGTPVHTDVELPDPTPRGLDEAPAPGAILLQDHGNQVRFRNIWIVPQPS